MKRRIFLVCLFYCFFRLPIYESFAAIFWQSASYVWFKLVRQLIKTVMSTVNSLMYAMLYRDQQSVEENELSTLLLLLSVITEETDKLVKKNLKQNKAAR